MVILLFPSFRKIAARKFPKGDQASFSGESPLRSICSFRAIWNIFRPELDMATTLPSGESANGDSLSTEVIFYADSPSGSLPSIGRVLQAESRARTDTAAATRRVSLCLNIYATLSVDLIMVRLWQIIAECKP